MPNTPDELTPQEQAELAQQEALIEEQAASDFSSGGGGAISDMQTQAYGATYTPAPPNTSIAYSGSDTKAYIVTYGQVAKDSFIPVNNLAAISYSVHRDKAPVRRLGSFVAESYTKGTRTIAGSIVVINFDRAAFYELVAGVDIYGEIGSEIELADNIPPFDILLVFSEENKGRRGALWSDPSTPGPPKPDDAADFSYMWIRNVHFVDEGAVTGTDEAYMETTLQYVAEHVEYMKPNNIFTATSDVGAIEASLEPTATQTYTKAAPYRIFYKQTDEIADYSSYTDEVWLDGTKGIESINATAVANFTLSESDNTLDPTTCVCSDGQYTTEPDCIAVQGNTWDCSKVYVPALRLANTEGPDAIWRRQETRIDLSQPNFPAHLTNFTNVDFDISGKVQGSADEMAAVVWESETLEPFAKRLTLKNAYFQPPPDIEPKKWWRPFKPQVDDRPRFGNKFQNDLHNVGKQMYEELTETHNYDASLHEPGTIPFDVQPGIIDQSLAEFANDLDDHSTAVSSVGDHNAERLDDDTLNVDIASTDVMQTDTFVAHIEIPLEEYTITETYVNMTNPPVNVEYTFNTHDPYNAPHPFLNHDATLAHDLVIDADGTGEHPFEIVSQDYSGEGATFVVSCPAQSPEETTVTATRPGPGIISQSKSWNQSFDGNTHIFTFQGDDGLPHIGPNPDHDHNLILFEAEHLATGKSLNIYLDEWKSFTQAGAEITAGDNAIPHYSTFEIHNYDAKIDADQITGLQHKVTNTEVITQPIGTYTWPEGTTDSHDFPYVSTAEGSPGSEFIHSIESIDIDVSGQALAPFDTIIATYHSHDGDSFVAQGVRNFQTEFLTTGFQAWNNGDVPVMPGFGPGHYENYNVWSPITGGGHMTADAMFTDINGTNCGYMTIPLELDGNDLVAKLGEATRYVNDDVDSGGLSYYQHLAMIPGGACAGVESTIGTVMFSWAWMYKEQIPTGLTYVRTDPTPQIRTEILESTSDVIMDINDFTVVLQDENGQYHDDFTLNLDGTGANWVLEIGNIIPHLDVWIQVDYKFTPIGTIKTDITWKTYQDQAFVTEVDVDLGPDEVVNFDTEGVVTLRCANSMANEGFIDPAAFGITIGPLVTSCSDGTSANRIDCEAQNETWSNKITISDIPAMTILNPNQSGWFGNIWNQLFGDPSQPQGNIIIIVDYKSLPFASAQLPIIFKYKYPKHPVTTNILTDNECRGITGINLIDSKEYGPDPNAGGTAEPIKIVNPPQNLGGVSGTCTGGTCTGAETGQAECDACNGAWTASSTQPNMIPMTNVPTSQSAMIAHEITDYDNMPAPPALTFEFNGIKALATDDNQSVFHVTLTYDIQRGLLPVELTYVRAMDGDYYAAVDLNVNYTYRADVPILTAPATHTSTGDQVVGGGAMQGPIDIVDKVYWIPEDPPGSGIFNYGTKIELKPAEPTEEASCDGGDCTGNETDATACADCGGTWTPATSSFDVSDATKAYYVEQVNTGTGTGGKQVVFPTGIDPVDDTLQTSLNEVSSDFSGNGSREYVIELEYQSLDLYIPPSKYETPGYMLTALVNITDTVDPNGDALQVVVDLDGAGTKADHGSINYYRGLGFCIAPGSVTTGTCDTNNAGGTGAVGTTAYGDETSCITHGVCEQHDVASQSVTYTVDVDENACNALASDGGTPNDPTDDITVLFWPYTWNGVQVEPYDTAADCIENNKQWVFEDEQDISLCTTKFGGEWLTSPGLQDPSRDMPQGICEMPYATLNKLISDKLLTQFSFMIAGRNAGPNGVGYDLYQHSQSWATMDEAAVEMKKEYVKKFGPTT